jgi:hypothetical protein
MMRTWCAGTLLAIGLGLSAGAGLAAETPVAVDVAGRWQGVSSGTDQGACGAVTFDVRVIGGRIGGSAQSRADDGKTVSWTVFGLVDSAGRVTLEISEPGAPRRERLVWTGRVDGDSIRLTRAADGACSTERTLDLSKK